MHLRITTVQYYTGPYGPVFLNGLQKSLRSGPDRTVASLIMWSMCTNTIFLYKATRIITIHSFAKGNNNFLRITILYQY